MSPLGNEHGALKRVAETPFNLHWVNDRVRSSAANVVYARRHDTDDTNLNSGDTRTIQRRLKMTRS